MAQSSASKAYSLASETYRHIGVDAEAALAGLAAIPISLHCWQGDDVGGFERTVSELGGGLAVTGNYPGKARTADELRADVTKALSLVPGRHRLNLHAIYGDFGGKKVDRDQIGPEHFTTWIDWAKAGKLHGLDFNPTCFAHPLASDNFTLASRDPVKRAFWVRHCQASRKIGAAMGKALGTPTVTNVWIPDGCKDTPADRKGPRERLAAALDEIFAEKLSPAVHLDAVEGKLFGIGTESYTVGSHEFYYGYALRHGTLLTLDAGHYHPTETITDKLTSVLSHLPEVLLHVSRGVRWDSDHVVTLGDDLYGIAREIVANGYQSRVHIGLDYFDASINRVAAWVIGVRNMQKALLAGLLEPTRKLQELEATGDFTSRLALQEELKTAPLGAVWDEFCRRDEVADGEHWIIELKKYESDVLSKRK